MNTKTKRLLMSCKRLRKAERKLAKAREETQWIKDNPHINVINYPIYKLLRIIKQIGGKHNDRPSN